jgi:hypothetical protein
VVTPSNATVLVLDRDGGGNLGLFVAIRVDMVDIPPVIRQRLATINAISNSIWTLENITQDTGALLIGYGHLSWISPALDVANLRDGIQPHELLPPGTLLGYSGDTGTAFGPHLDISVYYVSETGNSRFANAIMFESYDPVYTGLRYNWNAFYTIFDATQRYPADYFGAPIIVNPLVLWPSLQRDTTCTFEG